MPDELITCIVCATPSSSARLNSEDVPGKVSNPRNAVRIAEETIASQVTFKSREVDAAENPTGKRAKTHCGNLAWNRYPRGRQLRYKDIGGAF